MHLHIHPPDNMFNGTRHLENMWDVPSHYIDKNHLVAYPCFFFVEKINKILGYKIGYISEKDFLNRLH